MQPLSLGFTVTLLMTELFAGAFQNSVLKK